MDDQECVGGLRDGIQRDEQQENGREVLGQKREIRAPHAEDIAPKGVPEEELKIRQFGARVEGDVLADLQQEEIRPHRCREQSEVASPPRPGGGPLRRVSTRIDRVQRCAVFCVWQARLEAAGRLDGLAHAESRPPVVEERSVAGLLVLAAEARARVHVVHLSSPRSAQLVLDARQRGVDVTAETCPPYLFFSSEVLATLRGFAKCNPPLRDRDDVEGMPPELAGLSRDEWWREMGEICPTLQGAAAVLRPSTSGCIFVDGQPMNAGAGLQAFVQVHLYRDWTTATLSAVGKRFGDQVLDEVMTEGVKAWWLPNLEKMSQSSTLPQRIKMFVAGLRGHLQPMHIEEDEEKVVIQMRPCGSGGRLVLEGKYEGPNAFLTVEKPQRMTYHRANFPVYCAHEPPMELVDIEKNGAPFVVVEPAAVAGERTLLVHYL